MTQVRIPVYPFALGTVFVIFLFAFLTAEWIGWFLAGLLFFAMKKYS